MFGRGRRTALALQEDSFIGPPACSCVRRLVRSRTRSIASIESTDRRRPRFRPVRRRSGPSAALFPGDAEDGNGRPHADARSRHGGIAGDARGRCPPGHLHRRQLGAQAVLADQRADPGAAGLLHHRVRVPNPDAGASTPRRPAPGARAGNRPRAATHAGLPARAVADVRGGRAGDDRPAQRQHAIPAGVQEGRRVERRVRRRGPPRRPRAQRAVPRQEAGAGDPRGERENAAGATGWAGRRGAGHP